MGYFAGQVTLLLVLSVVVSGLMLGWWFIRFLRPLHDDEVDVELKSLRRNYDDAIRANAELRGQLRELEQTLNKLKAAPSTAGYGEFLKTRKTLEKTRNEYGRLFELSKQQGRQLNRLQEELKGAHCELSKLRQSQTVSSERKSVESSWRVLPIDGDNDDLTRIQGITPLLAGKLKALGILSCRQIAECSYEDLQHIQRVLGKENKLPLEDWVNKARSLFLQTETELQA